MLLPRLRGRLTPAAGLALVLAVALSGCGGDDPDGAGQAVIPSASSDVPAGPGSSPDGDETGDEDGAQQYVAMGDSYAAAPGVPQTDVARGCFRSDHNYPSLVAQTLGADLTDVSCSGAKTTDITSSQYDGVPAQVDSLSERTDLVTLGIGGNDEGLFTQLFSACGRIGSEGAQPSGGVGPCEAQLGEQTSAALATIETSVDATVAAVAAAAPRARVLVVGYPAIVPASGTCDLLSPLSGADSGYLREVNRALDDTLRDAARAHGADYVDVFRASRDHDVCARDPWVNGTQAAPDGTIPLHPLLAGTEGVAATITAAL